MDSEVSHVKLGIEGGKKVLGHEKLVPVGESEMQPSLAVSHRTREVEVEGVKKAEFDISPMAPFNKHTDMADGMGCAALACGRRGRGGQSLTDGDPPCRYNALMDPALKTHFRRESFHAPLVSNGLMSKEGFALGGSNKKAHHRRMDESLEVLAAKEAEVQEHKRQMAARAKAKKFAKDKQRYLESYRKQQKKMLKDAEALEKKVAAQRVSVADAPPTDVDREYLQQNKEMFEYRAEKAKMASVALETEAVLKKAKEEKQLKATNKMRKAALEESIAVSEAELAKVKHQIVETKQAAQRKKEKTAAARKARQERTKQEAAAFRETMASTFSQRVEDRKQEEAAREAKRNAEIAAAKAAAAKRERALEAERVDRQARERAEFAALRKEAFLEEQARRAKELEEKQRRAEAKAIFEAKQREEARQNRILVAQEKKAAEELAAEEARKFAAELQRRQEKNAADKAARKAALAIAEQAMKEKIKFENEMAKQLQREMIEAKEAAFKEEQARLWEEALAEELRIEKERKLKAKKAKEEAKKREIEAKKEAHRQEVLARKEAEAKVAKEEARKLALKKANAEMKRRVAYLNKFGV